MALTLSLRPQTLNLDPGFAGSEFADLGLGFSVFKG